MNEIAQGILLDVMNLTAIALVVGLITFAVVRMANPLLRWHEHGNVWTGPLRFEDLIVVFVLVGYYYLWALAAIWVERQGGGEGGEAREFGPMDIMLSMTVTIVVTGGLLFFLTYLRRIELSEIFGLRRMRPRQVFVWSFVAMLVVFPIVVLSMNVVWDLLFKDLWGDEITQQTPVELFQKSEDVVLRSLIVISACVIAPISEEIIFRGFIYATLKRYTERFFAAAVTSALFAIAHVSVPQMASLWLLAMFLTLAYELTGCLWVPILMHAIFNGVQTIFLLLGVGNGG